MSGELTRAQRVWRTRIFVATWATYFGYYFCRQAYGILKPKLAEEFGWDIGDLAYPWFAYLAAYAIGGMLSGALGRRLGSRILLGVGMAVSIACNVVFGFAATLETFTVFLVVNGFAQSTGWPGTVGNMAHWFRRTERGTVMGVWGTCYQAGSFVAKTFAGFLAALLGWSWSFWGGSLVLFAIWILFLILQRNRPEDAGLAPIVEDDEDGDETSARDKPRNLRLFLQVALKPTVLLMGTAYFCIKFLRYSVDSYVPLFATLEYGVSADWAWIPSVAFNVLGLAGCILAGIVSDRVFQGRRSLTALLMCVGMIVAYGLVWAFGGTGFFWSILFYGLVGFMLYGPDSLLSASGAIDVGSREGAIAAAGVINSMGSFGGLLQELLVAWIYKASGENMDVINGLNVGAAVAATLVVLFIWRRGRRRPSQEL